MAELDQGLPGELPLHCTDKDYPKFSDLEWIMDLAFLVDMLCHLDRLNLTLQDEAAAELEMIDLCEEAQLKAALREGTIEFWKSVPMGKYPNVKRAALKILSMFGSTYVSGHSFLRNPCFFPPNAPQGGKSLIQPRSRVEKVVQRRRVVVEQSPVDKSVPVFLPNPSEVFFTGYSVGHVYETTLDLKNLTASSRHVRVIPPTTPYFSIGMGRFPGEGGIVASGMSCKYTVRFAPDSLADYEDFIVVETQAQHPFLVPIKAQRPPLALTLPRVLDCGYCLIGGVKCVEFLCCNDGLSAETFCIMPKNQWPASNLRSVVTTAFAEQPPFAVSPSLFALQPGQTTVVEVVFFPTLAEKCCQVFTIVCDNCQVKDVTIQGEGQMIALELVSVSGENGLPVLGELCDLTAEHFVRFSPCNPHSVQEKKLVIRNNAHLELPFHWRIMKPNLQPLLPGEAPDPSHIQFHLAADGVFHISPERGVLAPCQDQEFLFTYFPKELKDYHSVCHLVLRDVPQQPTQSSGNGAPQPMNTASKVSDVIVMEIEVKGSTEPYQVQLEPYAIHISGELFIGTTTRRKFKMRNHSKSCILVQWERMSSCHIIEVEPSTGKLEVNECLDLDLVVTGGKPERVVTRLLCHIQHRHTPVTLAVEVSFKGPIVTLSVPSLDLGFVRVGEQTQTSVLLTNTTQLEASWTLEEKNTSQRDHHPPQIVPEPCGGVLPPLASCSVDVLFTPHSCQHFDTVLELAVENGTGCHLSVRKGASRKVAGFSSDSDEGNEAQEDEGQEEESEAHVAEDESQEEDEAEEAENSPPPRAQGKKAKGKSDRYRWKAMDNEFGDLPTILGESKMNVEGRDPIDFFSHLFTEEMIDDIVFNTNQYAVQKGNENLGLTSEEFKTFLGMNMVMSYIKYPRARMYWSSEEGLRLDLVADAMSVNRFEKILRYVHFVDNYSIDPENADRFVKIRPFLNALQGTFSASLDPEEYRSVDEMMIPFKEHLSIKQYVPKKPKPWGVKVWALKHQCIFGTGTCQKNRLHAAQEKLKAEKQMKKEERVSISQAIGVYGTENTLPDSLSVNQWTLFEKAVKLLEPFEELTRRVSSADSSAADVVPAITALLRVLEEECEEDRGV
ncbi:deleted in lung and esophageal cancer protein 1-like [Diretmus argenteus]